MTVFIRNNNSHRTTMYTLAELRKEAQIAAKGKGKLVGYQLECEEGPHGRVSLIAVIEDKDGFRRNHAIAI